MNLRLKISFFLILISLLGVIGSALLILQNAAVEKKKYITELSSVLGPQVKDSIDQKNKTLLNNLKEFSVTVENSQPDKSFKNRLTGVKAFFISKPSQTLFTLLFDPSLAQDESLAHLSEQLKNVDINLLDTDRFYYLSHDLYLFKTPAHTIGAVLLDKDIYKDSFDLARGKKSLLINSQNQILYQNKTDVIDSTLIAHLPTAEIQGTDLYTIEVKDAQQQAVLANYSKLNSINDTFILILSTPATWQDLAIPLLKSSLSLLLVLIFFSILIAYSISRSLAKPIELLSEETAKIGMGEWTPITQIETRNEIGKLTQAFNRMITNLKNRENELQIANAKLLHSENLAAIGRIGAGIAHEVKNPLSSILGYCQLIDLQLNALPNDNAQLEKFKNYNRLIGDDTRRANKIISDLLVFARQKELITEKTNIRNYLQNIEIKLKSFCEAHQVGFTTNSNQLEATHFINIDPEQIYQVIFNILQNAVHALNSGGKNSQHIQIQYAIQNNQLSIYIMDNGPGITPENINKIFEPFFSTKKVGEGSGLGLALCYGIMLKHNGQIQVESKLAESTCFTLKLPLAS